jgi:hypothetical protein
MAAASPTENQSLESRTVLPSMPTSTIGTIELAPVSPEKEPRLASMFSGSRSRYLFGPIRIG